MQLPRLAAVLALLGLILGAVFFVTPQYFKAASLVAGGAALMALRSFLLGSGLLGQRTAGHMTAAGAVPFARTRAMVRKIVKQE